MSPPFVCVLLSSASYFSATNAQQPHPPPAVAETIDHTITVTITQLAELSANTAVALALAGISAPMLDPRVSIYASGFLGGMFLLFVMAVLYLGVSVCWHLSEKCRRRWVLGSMYEMELREARVGVGESAGSSDAGGSGRAVVPRPAVGRRAALWWRAGPGDRTAEGGRRALRFSGVQSAGGVGGAQRTRGSVALEQV